MKRPGFAVLLFIVVTALLYPARASADAASPWYETEQGRARLIAATADPGSAASIGLGLQFELAPHWKISSAFARRCRLPARRLDWKGSANLADATIAWPAPERFSVQGLETAGYSGAVVLPITVRVAQRASRCISRRISPISLAARFACRARPISRSICPVRARAMRR